MATTYLSRAQGTPTGAGKKATVSFWMKKTVDDGAGDKGLFEVRDVPSATSTFDIYTSGNKLGVGLLDSASWVGSVWSNAKILDQSAWYHVVAIWDSPQATPADRIKLYINGVLQTSLGSPTYPSQDHINNALAASSGYTQQWGRYATSAYWDGYLAQCVFVDGEVYAVTTFGSFDDITGEWKPKSDGEIRTAVTFGDQGCLLPFSNASYLGYDYQTSDRSGTTNDFTVTGSGYKAQDNPSNNFATYNPLDNYYQSIAYSHGNTTLTTTSLISPGLSTIGMEGGKWYWEVKAGTASNIIGIQGNQINATGQYLGENANDWGYFGTNGNSYNNGSSTSYGDTYTTADIIGVAVDLDNNKLYFSKNGTFQNSGVPTSGATGTGALAIGAASSTALGCYLAGITANVGSAITTSGNFGQGYFGTTSVGETNADDAGLGIFKYDVPAGFYSLCTKNLKTYG